MSIVNHAPLTAQPVLANANRVTPFLLVGGSIRSGSADPVKVVRELRSMGLTHILDCRTESSDAKLVRQVSREVVYHQAGTEDDADGTADGWFESGVTFARRALEQPDAVLLVHCALGQARGPSMAFAVLLDRGFDPGDALLKIIASRPQARANYAEQALDWHLSRIDASPRQRQVATESLRAARQVTRK